MSLLAVFIPILMMGGIVGRLFREFAVTLSIAIAMSAVVSLTLTPMMCSELLRSHHSEQRGFFYRVTERIFDGMLNVYGRALAWVLKNHYIALAAMIATLAFTVYLFIVIPKGLFPQQDTGMLTGFSEAAQDVSFPALVDRQKAVNDVINADPDIDCAVSYVGAGNTGVGFISLKPKPERKASADQIINRLRPKLAKVPGMMFYLQAAQDIRVGGRVARTQYQYTLQDANIDELRVWSNRVVDTLKKVRQLKDVAIDLQAAGLQMTAKIDRDTASRLGIRPQSIDDALYDAFGQRQVATTYTQLNQYHVVIEALPSLQARADGLDGIYVPSATTGGQVPLRAIASYVPEVTSLSVNHQGQFPAVTVSFNLTLGTSLGQAVDAIHEAERKIGLPPTVHASFQGTAQAFAASLASQPMLIGAALLTVYIVLGMLYESFIHPITILSTLPSAGVGALVTLMLFKTDFGVIALIGIILLIGIVKKNAIMMIDFALEAEREEGLNTRDFIYKACLLRFRPIMMTTLAALLGGLPLALGTGTGSELRQPLGISIVGGLIFSQMLTLFTTPVVYLELDRFTERSRHVRKRPKPVVSAPA